MASPEVGFSFQVELRKKPRQRLGVDVVLRDCGLVVERVNKGGIVESWNLTSKDPERIRPGDLVVEVNGSDDNTKLASLLWMAGDVKFTVWRSETGTQPPVSSKSDPQVTGLDSPLSPVQSQAAQIAKAKQQIPPAQLKKAVPLVVIAKDKGQAPKGKGAPFAPVVLLGNGRKAGGPVGVNGGFPPAPPIRAPGDYAGLPGVIPANSTAVSAAHGPAWDAQGYNAIPQDHVYFEIILKKTVGGRLGINVVSQTIPPNAGFIVTRIHPGCVDDWNRIADEHTRVIPGDSIVTVDGCAGDLGRMWERLDQKHRCDLYITIYRAKVVPAPPGFAPVGVPTSKLKSGGNAGAMMSQGGSMSSSAPAFRPASAQVGTTDRSLSEEVFHFHVVLEPVGNKRVGIDVISLSDSQLQGFIVERVKGNGRLAEWNQTHQEPYRVRTGDFIIQVNNISAWQSLSLMGDEFANQEANRQFSFTVQRGPPGMLQHHAVKHHLALVSGQAAPMGDAGIALGVLPDSAPPPPNWTPGMGPAEAIDCDDLITIDEPEEHEWPTAIEEPKEIAPRSPDVSEDLPKKLLQKLSSEPDPTPTEPSDVLPIPAPPPAPSVGSSDSADPKKEQKSGQCIDANPDQEEQKISQSADSEEEQKEPAPAQPAGVGGVRHSKKSTPATLLRAALQLGDDEMTALLRSVLARKPWLRTPVSQALSGLQ